jgi:hypothetical protein
MLLLLLLLLLPAVMVRMAPHSGPHSTQQVGLSASGSGVGPPTHGGRRGFAQQCVLAAGYNRWWHVHGRVCTGKTLLLQNAARCG